MLRSLPKNVTVNNSPSSQVSVTQLADRKASAASARPKAPTDRRPQVRLPVRRISQSDAEPPRMQATAPAASGSADSQAVSTWSRWRCSLRYRGSMFVKKLPEKPVQPYIRHSDQTLSEPAMRDQGTARGWLEVGGRPATIRSRSPRLTWAISSGRLRNHGQKAAHHRTPRQPINTNGMGQPPNCQKSQTNRNGMSVPPRRLSIQIAPWAKPRSVTGIQSAMMRPITGKPPAWNAPNRKRRTSRNVKHSATSAGNRTVRATAAVKSDQPSTRSVRT